MIVPFNSQQPPVDISEEVGLAALNKLPFALTDNDVDDLAYSLRAIVSQMLNHKARPREVPLKWRPKFQVLFDKLDVSFGEAPTSSTACDKKSCMQNVFLVPVCTSSKLSNSESTKLIM